MPTFVIGSGVGDNYATFLLPVPDVTWFKSALLGALFEMTVPNNWVEMGDVATSFAVEEAAQMIASYKFMNFNPFPIGMIMPFGGDTAPDGYALCDGSVLSAIDYPELFTVLGYSFGGSGDNFNLPSLTNRVVVGAGGDYAIAETGGEKNHTLTEDEIPSHSHTIGDTVTTLVFEPGEVPALTPIPIIPGYTGATGGGQSHNNMQPFQAINYIIYKGRI